MNNKTDYYFSEEKNETTLLKKIICFVIASHILLICFFSFYHSEFNQLRKKTSKCHVRTIHQKNLVNPEKSEVQKTGVSLINNQKKPPPLLTENAQKTKIEEVKKIETKPKEVKKVEKKEVTSKVTTVRKMESKKVERQVVSKPNETKPNEKIAEKISTKGVVEESTLKKRKELLALAKQNLAAVDGNGKSSKKSEFISKGAASTVENLKTFEVVNGDEFLSSSSSDISYEEELALRLRSFLTLPERGDVKIKLTLAKSGQVLNVAVVSFQSERNRKYIEEKVKALIFPQFQGDFSRYPEYTFSITLK